MKQILINLPKEPLVADRKSTIDTERVHYYVIQMKYTKEINDKLWYDEQKLINLIEIRQYSNRTVYERVETIELSILDTLKFKDFTDGKKALRINSATEEPMYEIEESGQYRFYPQFFKYLGKHKARLLRIQAPIEWHVSRNRDSEKIVHVDPDITVFWEPKYQ